MLCFKTFIFSIFIGLSVASPLDFNGETSTFEDQEEIVMSSFEGNAQALLVNNHLETNPTNYSLKTFKIVNHYLNDDCNSSKANSYNHRLLYLKIGNTISLKLTPKTIIFPSHSFT